MNEEAPKIKITPELVRELSKYDVSKDIPFLLHKEPFFACVSVHIKKIKSLGIPTAGVCFNKKTRGFEMLYNPIFMALLPEEHRIGVLKHEFYHIILRHTIDKRKPADTNHKVWNVAADLAINSYISNELPEWTLVPGRKPFEDLPMTKSTEWYYNTIINDPEMMEKVEKEVGTGSPMKIPGSGQGEEGESGEGKVYQFDDHEGQGEDGEGEGEGGLSKEEENYMNEKVKSIVKEAAQKADAKDNGWGNTPAAAQIAIRQILIHKLDWKGILRYFVKTSQRAEKYSSIKKINRRFPYIHPGKNVRRYAELLIMIDQSGSVSNFLLTKMMAELVGLAKYARFTFAYFDTEVDEDNIITWHKGQRIEPKRTRCGGTDFNAPTRYANEHKKYDGLIIMTDMDAPAPIRCKVKRLWITDERGKTSGYHKPTQEMVVAITED